ncbi:hypothetical protein H2200_001457 [Cladophialophora chaetospira]|uniref:Uncharacterized protein n=1 Tax=Cladophialophora chaetospira TaxID=386627 RepID=A0AA39CPM1_9EURO|nr:hypothetical protein H2200_001457 [Cladophialophora chaetospira]
MADMARPASFLTIPAELRVMIWKLILPKVHYFGGYTHQRCPYYKKVEDETNSKRSPRLPPCPCNDRQLRPLYLCKSLYNEMKYVLERAEIEAEYTSPIHCALKPSMCGQIRTLILDQTVFPVVECGIGFLKNRDYDDFPKLFPRLKKIIMPEGLGDGLGLRFPSSLPMHIYSCLRSRNGPDAMPNADCTEIVCSDLEGAGYELPFWEMDLIIHKQDVSVVSSYRYTIQVAEHVVLDWPFVPDLDDMREIYRAERRSDIVWDKQSMRVLDIPDLRTEWWFDEWMREVENKEPSHISEIDWTAELGGWDLMDLLSRQDDKQRFWADVNEDSYSFH